MRLLVDADIVIFRFASAFSEPDVDWGNGVKTKGSNFNMAKASLDKFVKYLQGRTFSTKVTMCLTDQVNFRYSVLPTYKYNRAGQQKPELYKPLKKYVELGYECKTKPGLEADDVLGIMATLDPHNTCIATIDKDLLQIPGRHFNWDWDRVFHCDIVDCDNYFYQQILTGDPGDGYKGIPGIGIARACKLLEMYNHDHMWEEIVESYADHGLTEKDALQQARVARMCRAEDYDFDKGEVILWTP